MNIIIKTEDEISKLRKAGKIHGEILEKLGKFMVPGMSTKDIDDEFMTLCKTYKVKPAFLGFQPRGISYPYPAGVCVSINEEIVHGIPSNDKIIKIGDLVSIDVGIKMDNVYTDAAKTFVVGNSNKKLMEMIKDTEEALMAGIMKCVPGNYVNDISKAIAGRINDSKNKYGIVRGLAGHGVGREIHEDPFIPNYADSDPGPLLKKGMVLALEPMITLGSWKIKMEKDQYTYTTADKSLSAHVEHTVLVDDKPEILTLYPQDN